MKAQAFPRLSTRLLRTAILGLALAALAPAVSAAGLTNGAKAPEISEQALDANATYKQVDLKTLVAASRTEVPGQRIIFSPSPIRFRATLGALPSPQKSEYLMSALGMMKISNPPKVSQRIALDYGGERPIAAYIEDAAAARLARELKPGDARTFYAFHVYNSTRGPALLVMSFAD